MKMNSGINMTGKTIKAIGVALSDNGYSLEEIFGTKCRDRRHADMRAIVWKLYQEDLYRSPSQIARVFGWNRATIYCAIIRANKLCKYDRSFAELYSDINKSFQEAKLRA